MRTIASLMISCAALSWPAQVRADPHCMARALADVPAMEAPEEVRSKRNSQFGPITQVKVKKRTGRMFYCAQNTYCYDSNAFQLTTPCRIKLDKSFLSGFGSSFVYFTR